METDPKGQLGGLETPDATRKRLALESQTFRCSACGKTNKEIIQECTEQAAVNGIVSEDEGPGVDVPSELKMGWKDEMNGSAVVEHEKPEREAKAGPEGRTESECRTDSDGEEARLAEGFVQTAPVRGPSVPSTSTVAGPAARADAARPAATRRRQGARANNGVPAWLDQLIVFLLVLLVAVLLHRVIS